MTKSLIDPLRLLAEMKVPFDLATYLVSLYLTYSPHPRLIVPFDHFSLRSASCLLTMNFDAATGWYCLSLGPTRSTSRLFWPTFHLLRAAHSTRAEPHNFWV